MIFRDAVKKMLIGHKIRHKKWPKHQYIRFLEGDSVNALSHFIIHFENGLEEPYNHLLGSKPDENVWKLYY